MTSNDSIGDIGHGDFVACFIELDIDYFVIRAECSVVHNDSRLVGHGQVELKCLSVAQNEFTNSLSCHVEHNPTLIDLDIVSHYSLFFDVHLKLFNIHRVRRDQCGIIHISLNDVHKSRLNFHAIRFNLYKSISDLNYLILNCLNSISLIGDISHERHVLFDDCEKAFLESGQVWEVCDSELQERYLVVQFGDFMLELGDIAGKNTDLCILGSINSFLHGNSGAILTVGFSEFCNALHKCIKAHLRLHKSRSLGSDGSHQSSDFVHELHQLGIDGFPNVDMNGAVIMGVVF